jgi:hypothetical protein
MPLASGKRGATEPGSDVDEVDRSLKQPSVRLMRPSWFIPAAAAALFSGGACSVYEPSLLSGGESGSALSSGTAGSASGSPSSGGDPGLPLDQGGGKGSSGESSQGGVAGNGDGAAGKSNVAGNGGGAAGEANVAGKGNVAGTGNVAGEGHGGGALGNDGTAGEAGMAGCPLGDCCPSDDKKTEPGLCGCGVPDTDADGDGVPSCRDECDADPKKTAPEKCGCNVAEASCLPLKNSLVHRYSFSGTGKTVTDSKGTAHGLVLGNGAQLGGSGTLTLAGGIAPVDSDPNQQYVALPAGCLNGLSDATFEAWVDWKPADSLTEHSYWQRIFDFGENAASGTGTYIFLSPRATSATGPVRASFTSSMGSSGQIFSNGPTIAAGAHHFALVIDDSNNLMSLYVDGVFSSSVPFPGSLSAINDTNCWLGRSQFVADVYFSGIYDEFRVYSSALAASDVSFSHAAGPNPTFL